MKANRPRSNPTNAASEEARHALSETTLGELTPDPQNARVHTPRNLGVIAEALQDVGAARSIVIDEAGVILAGNATVEAAGQVGITKVRVVEASGHELIAVRRRGLSPAQKARLAIADNRAAELAEGWDADVLRAFQEQGLELDRFFTEEELEAILAQEADDDAAGGGAGAGQKLADRFIVPPFSVLDSKQGYWRDRKQAWLALGIQSEIGRDGNLLGHNMKLQAQIGIETGTSIFDPVLCELAVRWFAPPAGVVLDPFAGGSVRGIIAAKLGRRYVGIELREAQVAANRAQATDICGGEEYSPEYVHGDARQLEQLLEGLQADFLFSCPPYADLERYSDDPRDLSTLEYAGFLEAYRAIIAAGVARLKPNRFACFVVGDLRDKRGFYRGFVADTIRAFEDAGARLYNDAVLLTSLGSLPVRAAKGFEVARKLGKTHQNVLVFCKGDPRKATQAVGPVEAGEIEAMTEAAAEGAIEEAVA
jgi:hypothetical protein